MTPILARRSALKVVLTGLAAGCFPQLQGATLPGTKPKLAFSTLGCPNWDLATIIATAVRGGYQGVELRGLRGELDLTKSPEFASAGRAADIKRQFAQSGVHICNLGSSAQLHHADRAKRTQHLDEAQRYIDLAHQLDCPFVRVFPDQLSPDQNREQTLALISQGLLELGTYARSSGVSVLLESHGELTRTDLLLPLMQQAKHPHVGLIWDIVNMWVDAHEPVGDVYRALAPYIRHVHVKDAMLQAGKPRYVPVGQGEAPLREAIAALQAGGYNGYYSFEWEKRWHPEIAEPEAVIPFYPAAVTSVGLTTR
ncbi:sugar phosphate isomerase/epimerase family protein [Fibrella aquatilis]|uniref:Sugar phosphate isomerase/epimerase n=1 Tax=Fibrella aquatilis TaxID=2817059 RepID=A0A939JXU6_9BACT|nr:sugar phosphate isomerase/epimerase family protein [Fibrella aquatilis]MBO0929678.1 sugar phosphate isomerase/epimerase [Fibrella aquatilis]